MKNIKNDIKNNSSDTTINYSRYNRNSDRYVHIKSNRKTHRQENKEMITIIIISDPGDEQPSSHIIKVL